MTTKDLKIVVFDLDETLGYFVELSIFILVLEEFLNKKISSEEIFKLLDLFPEFLRPKILTILDYLKSKKSKSNKIKVMIYTNNQGPRSWVTSIKDYFEDKLNYKLFDQIIAAFKVKGKRIEMCRTTHSKTVNDFLNCTQLPKETKICFLDDQYHEDMESENVYYINVKPYYHTLSFNEMAERYYDNNSINKPRAEFVNSIVELMDKKHFNVIVKDEKEQKIDEIVSKKIISHLYDFFKLNINNKTRKYSKRNNKKTRKI